jgi:RimJ/RimL family protein N-acetyltransferase
VPPIVPPDGSAILRPLREEDVAPYVQAFRDDPALGPLLGIEEDPDEERLRGRIARLPELMADGRFAELAIGPRFAGSLTLHSVDWKNGRAEIGFFVVPAARGQGLASAAIGDALAWAFGALDLARVEMTTTPDNAAVAVLAERHGFTREGMLRARNLERGRRVDVVWFGLLRDEWVGASSRT